MTPLSPARLLGLLLPLSLGVSTLSHADPAAQSPLELSAKFDTEPKMQGLEVERDFLEPTTVTVDGKTTEAWVAKEKSAPGARYARSFLFKITDERFRNGKMPAIDMEIEYLHRANSGVRVIADTTEGSKEVGGGWGRSEQWKTAKFTLDNAFFGARSFGNPPEKLASDGYDFRINAANGDFILRSVRIRGYDLDRDVDFSRLLRLEKITSDQGVFAFRQGEPVNLQYKFRNISRQPLDATYEFVVTDRSGREHFRDSGQTLFAASARDSIALTFSTKDLPLGIYDVLLTLRQAGTEAKTAPIFQRETSIGIINHATLRKAGPGEFLYGMDVKLGDIHHDASLLKWLDLLGVDIVRHWTDVNKPEQTKEAVMGLQARGLQFLPMLDMPNQEDPKRFQTEIARVSAFAQDLAHEFSFKYWELGNEPDLPFFYAGPIERYNEAFGQVAMAIKSVSPHTVVMNGGLSFFGKDGEPRSRKFVEIVDPKTLDAFAYHGHGVGVQAEREALERIRRTAREFGKESIPYIETESGVSAKTKDQEFMQARTVIQKIVYAQSQGMPLFIWFRLWMPTEGYTNLNSTESPRPAVLAYRTMVEVLRGFTFTKMLDLGEPDTEAYLFEQKDGPDRVCVWWGNHPSARPVYLSLGTSASKIGTPKLIDLFSNEQAVEVLPEGSVKLAISESPTFLKWQALEPTHPITVVPPIVSAPASIPVVPDHPGTVTIRLRNPFPKPVTAEWKANVEGETKVTLTPASASVELPASGVADVAIKVEASPGDAAFTWPQSWTVYADLPNNPEVATITSSPAEIEGVQGRRTFLRDGLIDFASVAGGVREKAIAIAVAEIDSPKDQTIAVGASADWWMAWAVNGQPVFDTLQTGNGGWYSLTDHLFTIPLKQGKNIIAVKVISGKGGWKLLSGGPEELRHAQSQGTPADRLEFSLSAEGKPLGQAMSALQIERPVTRWTAAQWLSPLEEISQNPPAADLGENEVHNLFVQHPDSSRWWKGDRDLSAQIWIGSDSEHLYLVAKVQDDTLRLVSEAGQQTQGDALQLAIAAPDTTEAERFTITKSDDGATVWQDSSGKVAGDSIQAKVERLPSGQTIYRVAIDRAVLPGSNLLLNARVTDRDRDELKQFLTWRLNWESPTASWKRAVLEK